MVKNDVRSHDVNRTGGHDSNTNRVRRHRADPSDTGFIQRIKENVSSAIQATRKGR